MSSLTSSKPSSAPTSNGGVVFNNVDHKKRLNNDEIDQKKRLNNDVDVLCTADIIHHGDENEVDINDDNEDEEDVDPQAHVNIHNR